MLIKLSQDLTIHIKSFSFLLTRFFSKFCFLLTSSHHTSTDQSSNVSLIHSNLPLSTLLFTLVALKFSDLSS